MIKTDLRVEAALRSVYRERVGSESTLTELAARIDDIPARVRPDRPRWLQRGLAIAGLAAAVVVAVGALDRIRQIAIVSPSPGAGATAPFDPVHPAGGLVALSGVTVSGLHDLGTILLLTLGIGMGLWLVVGFLRGSSVAEEAARSNPQLSGRARLVRTAMVCLILLPGFVLNQAEHWNPLTRGSVTAPGLGWNERRTDGINPERLADPFGGLSDPPGIVTFGGSRDIYRVTSGQPLTYVVAVRNDWPVSIRLLGRWTDSTASTDATEAIGSAPTGLGLLRDPNTIDASIENTIPFTSVDLAPGAEVSVVVAEVGRPCADPNRKLPIRIPSNAWTVPRMDFVYEVFGIEAVGSFGITPEVTVPSSCV